MFTVGVDPLPGLRDRQVVLNLFIDNAFLLVVAVGMTFVILTGGIDLSVGSVVALSTLIAALLVKHGWPPSLAIVVVLVIGSTARLGDGLRHPLLRDPAVHRHARRACSWRAASATRSPSTPISITKPDVRRDRASTRSTCRAACYVTTGGRSSRSSWSLVGVYVLHYTRLGRNVYAIGGNEQSALLMGLPVARTKIAVYTISGFCSALGGLLLSFYMLSGSGSLAVGMELDAIAAVVIGGTLLTGGRGYVVGSLLGVLVLGLIQTLITFDGTLSSWWTRIVIGALLLAFILLQRLRHPADSRDRDRPAQRQVGRADAGDGRRRPARRRLAPDRLAGHQRQRPAAGRHARARARQAMRMLGYRPNPVGAGAGHRRSETHRRRSSSNTTLYGPASTLVGPSRRAGSRGGLLRQHRQPPVASTARLVDAIDHLRAQGVEGILLIAPQTDEALARSPELPETGIPVVVVEGDPAEGVPVVGVDQVAGAELGHPAPARPRAHRTVWHIAGPDDWTEARGRIAGWRRRCSRPRAAPVPPVLVGDWTARSRATRLGRRARRRDPDVTAVFAANDQMALGPAPRAARGGPDGARAT